MSLKAIQNTWLLSVIKKSHVNFYKLGAYPEVFSRL